MGVNDTIAGIVPCMVLPVVEAEGELEEEAVSMIVQGIMIALAFVAVKLISKYHIPLMTECGAVILTGFFIGGLLHFIKPSFGRAAAKFNSEAFFLIILPPIIFEAGFSLTSSKSSLSSNTGTILILAIVGTMISTLIVGTILYLGFGPVTGGVISLWEAFAFGSLISAVDPVATLAVLSEVFPGSKPSMFYLVFGESVINDAVSIVLFTVCEGMLRQEDSGGSGTGIAAGVIAVFLKFWGVFIGSIIVGILITLLTALFIKVVDLRGHSTIELVTVLLSALSTYSIAQALELSGIMAIFVAGRLMKHWVLHNISVSNKIFLPRLIKAIAETAELYVFAFLGASFWTTDLEWDPMFISATFGVILLGRAANIFPLCGLSNYFRDENSEKITFKEQIFMWFSGLRGAIAFALACYGTNTGVLKNGAKLVTTTLVTVMLTVFVFGGLAKPLLNLLNLAPTDQRVRTRRASRMSITDVDEEDDDDNTPELRTGSELLDPLNTNASHAASHDDLFDEEETQHAVGATYGPPPTFEETNCCSSTWRRVRHKIWKVSRTMHEADVRYIKPFVCVQLTQTDLRRERVVQKLLREGSDHTPLLLALRDAQRRRHEDRDENIFDSPKDTNDARFQGMAGGLALHASMGSDPRTVNTAVGSQLDDQQMHNISLEDESSKDANGEPFES